MIEKFKDHLKNEGSWNVAAGALDEVAKIAKPGTRTEKLINYASEYINDHGAYSAPFIEAFQNHVVLLQTM